MVDVVIGTLFVLWLSSVAVWLTYNRMACAFGRHRAYRPQWYRCAVCYYCGVHLPNRSEDEW
jgi:hypothetical protein